MCFSPEIDLVTGAVTGLAGIDALRHVHSRRQLPLAALPLLFAGHQITEATVWWGVQDEVSEGIGRVGTWSYLTFALVVLPVLIPGAVALIEPPSRRRHVMVGLVALGAVVSATLGYQLLVGPVGARAASLHIEYSFGAEYLGLTTTAYLIATCAPLLLAEAFWLRVYGAFNVVAVASIGTLNLTGVVSLWCFWAGVTSMVIVIHLRGDATEPTLTPASPSRLDYRSGASS